MIAVRDSLVTFINQPAIDTANRDICAVSKRVAQLAAVTLARFAVALLNALNWICATQTTSKKIDKEYFSDASESFVDLIVGKGSISSAKIFVKTDAGSKEFTVRELNEINEQTKELIEKAKSFNILFCASVSYSESNPSCVYLSKRDGNTASGVLSQRTLKDADDVYEARKTLHC